MNNKKLYGILLTDEAYDELSDILEPYIQKGPIGKYIYGTKAVQHGVFLDIIISPELVKGRIKNDMEISIPLRFVKFVASASSLDELIGFRASKRGKNLK